MVLSRIQRGIVANEVGWYLVCDQSHNPHKHIMAPYDSDSSGGEEEEEFTETNVLLGYASKDADDDTISRLGGRPVSAAQSSPNLRTLRSRGVSQSSGNNPIIHLLVPDSNTYFANL